MNSAVDQAAREATDGYAELLNSALPGVCAGLYLTGSAVIGDWVPGRSDLDIVTITTRRLDDADLDALAELHAKACERPYLDAMYLHSEDLAARPAPGDRGVPHAMNGIFHRDGYLPDPVLLASLDRHGLAMAGPPAAELGVAPDPGWLRDWNVGNLRSYWRPWAADARASLASRDPGVPLNAEGVTHGLLGPGRLHYTIVTGQLLAKTMAADYTARHFPGYDEVLARAKAWRLGDDSVQFRRADGLATCDLVDVVVDDAVRLASQ